MTHLLLVDWWWGFIFLTFICHSCVSLPPSVNLLVLLLILVPWCVQATQEVVSRLPETTAAEFNAAVAAAKAAFPAWRATPVPTRQRVMLKFQELIRANWVSGAGVGAHPAGGAAWQGCTQQKADTAGQAYTQQLPDTPAREAPPVAPHATR